MAAQHQFKMTTISSKGQITVSTNARHQLGVEKGDCLLEIVVGNCVIYLPQHQILDTVTQQAQNALAKLGVKVEDILAEVEKYKQDNLHERYPGIFE